MQFLKLLVLLGLTVFTTSSDAQSYHPFLEQGKTWDVYYAIDPVNNPPFCGADFARHYLLKGDTVIGPQSYQKIYYLNIVPINPPAFCPPFGIDISDTLLYTGAFLREDTVAKQVFWFDPATPGEFMVYDYSLLAGDSLHTAYLNYRIDSVSTIQLLNGDIRKILYVQSGFNSDPFNFYIEGVGGPNGMWESITNYSSSVLCCVKQNSIPLFEAYVGSDGGCAGILSTEEYIGYDGIDVECLNNHIIVDNELGKATIKVFDINGRQLYADGIGTGRKTFDFSYLPSGIYLMIIEDSNNEVTSTKFYITK